MKKPFLTVAILFAAVLSLSAAPLNIPVLFDAPQSKAASSSLEQFGYLETPDYHIFAFLIKDFQKLLKNPKPSMSFYMDTDFDLTTGRFPKDKGWDFQINCLFWRKKLYAMSWNSSNKSQDFRLNAKDYQLILQNSTCFMVIRKSAMPGLVIKDSFRFRTTLGPSPNFKVQKKGLGSVFAETLQLPADL